MACRKIRNERQKHFNMKEEHIDLISLTFFYANGIKLILEEKTNPGIGKTFYTSLIKKRPNLNWKVEKQSKNSFGFIRRFFEI